MEQEQQTPEVPETGEMAQNNTVSGGEQEHMSKNAIILIVLVVIVLVLVLMYVWGSRTSTPGQEQPVVDTPTMTFEEFVTQDQAPLTEAAADVNGALGGLQSNTFMSDIDALESDLDVMLAE